MGLLQTKEKRRAKTIKKAFKYRTYSCFRKFAHIIDLEVENLDHYEIIDLIQRPELTETQRKKISKALLLIRDSTTLHANYMNLLLFEENSKPLVVIRNNNIEIENQFLTALVCNIAKI